MKKLRIIIYILGILFLISSCALFLTKKESTNSQTESIYSSETESSSVAIESVQERTVEQETQTEEQKSDIDKEAKQEEHPNISNIKGYRTRNLLKSTNYIYPEEMSKVNLENRIEINNIGDKTQNTMESQESLIQESSVQDSSQNLQDSQNPISEEYSKIQETESKKSRGNYIIRGSGRRENTEGSGNTIKQNDSPSSSASENILETKSNDGKIEGTSESIKESVPEKRQDESSTEGIPRQQPKESEEKIEIDESFISRDYIILNEHLDEEFKLVYFQDEEILKKNVLIGIKRTGENNGEDIGIEWIEKNAGDIKKIQNKVQGKYELVVKTKEDLIINEDNYGKIMFLVEILIK